MATTSSVEMQSSSGRISSSRSVRARSVEEEVVVVAFCCLVRREAP